MSTQTFPVKGSLEYTLLQQALSTKKFLSTQEASCYLDITMHALYKLTCRNTWSLHKPNGKKIYIKREDLDDWIKKREVIAKHINRGISNYFLK